MASDFLKKKAAEQRTKNGGSTSSSASAFNTSANATAPKASSFLQKKAAERAAAMDEKYGQDSYGGSAWREQKIATADTRYRNNQYKNKYLGMTESQMQRAIWDLEDGEEKNWLLDNRQNLLNEYYQKENKNKFFQLSNNARAAADYNAGKQAQSDAERLRNAFAETVLPIGSFENPTVSKYLKTSQNDDLDYLEEKYGTRNYLQLKRLIDAEIDTYSSELEDAGFNFDRMADYEKRQQDERDRAVEKAENRKFADEHGVLSSLATIGAAPAQGIDYLAMLGQQVQNSFRGEDDWRPVDTSNMDVTNFVRDIRGRVGENIEENTELTYKGQNVARFLYDTAMSMGDSAATIMLAGPAASYLLGGAAAAQSAKDVLENGGSATQAALSGLSAGAFEMLFERYSIEKLLEPRSVTSVKRLVTETMKQGGVEASEEMATEVSNILANALIMGRDSDFNNIVEAYVAEGYSKEEAQKQALLACVSQVAWAGAGGALSGGVMGGGVNALNLAGNAHEAKQLYGEDPEALIQETLEADQDNRLAKKLQDKVAKGEKISGLQLSTLNEQKQTALEKRQNTPNQSAEEDLRDVGEQAQTYHADSAKPLSRNEQELADKYESHSGAWEAAYRLGTSEDAETFDKGFNAVYTIGRENGNLSALDDSVLLEGMTEAQIDLAYQAGLSAYDKANEGRAVRVSDGEYVDVVEIAEIQDGDITFALSDGTTSSFDDIAQISSADDSLYHSLMNMQISAADANAVVESFHNRGSIPAQEFVKGLEGAYFYGTKGMNMNELKNRSVSVEKMDNSVLELVYKAGEEKTAADAKAASERAEKRKTDSKTGASKVGGVLFMENGTTTNLRDHFADTGKKLNKRQEAAVLMMEKLSAMLGIEFYVYESYVNNEGSRVYSDRSGTERKAPNGYYTMGTGKIAVDLNAGNSGEGLMLYTTGHELTHFIQSWSETHYKILCDAVIAEYSASGKSFTDMLRGQQEKAHANGRTIIPEEAFDEAIADSMEAILADGDVLRFMTEVQSKDQTLWDKIRSWFEKLLNDLKTIVDAYKDVKPNSPEGRFVQEAEAVRKRLQPIFAEALLDAGANYQSATKNTAEDGGVVKYSLAQDAKGNPFVIVDTDILANVPEKQWVSVVKKNLARRFPNGVKVGNSTININKQSRRELTFSKYTQWLRMNDRNVYADKLRATNHADEIILATRDYINEGLKHARKDNIQDFARGTVLMEIGHSQYSAEVVVGFDSYGQMLLYDILQITPTVIQKKSDRTVPEKPSRNGTTADNSISEKQPNGNRKFSFRAAEDKDVLGHAEQMESEENQYSTRDARLERANETLERQNKRLESDVKYLKELVKLQGQVTKGGKFTRSSVDSAARYLKKQFHAEGETRELTDLLNDFYEFIAAGDELTAESVREAAQPAVDWLHKHVKEEPAPLDPRAEEVLGIMKSTKIRFSEGQKKEAAFVSGSWGLYRNGIIDHIKVTDKATTTLDQFWSDMADSYPTLFDKSISDTEQPVALQELIYDLQNMRQEEDTGYTDDLFEAEIFNEVYDCYWRVSTLHTVADKYEARYRDLKHEHDLQMKDARELLKNTKAKMEQERRLWVEKARQEERAKAQEQQKKLKEKNQESRKRATENRAAVQEKQKIRRRIGELRRLFEHGSKDKNVKEGLREFVQATLDSADVLFTKHLSNEDIIRNGIGTDLTEEEQNHLTEAKEIMKQLDELTGVNYDFNKVRSLEAQLQYRMGQLKDVFVRERARLNKTKVRDVMQQLMDAYKEMEGSTDPLTSGAYSLDLYNELAVMREWFDNGVTVKDMSLEQLQQVNKAYSMVLHAVRNANKLFAENIRKTTQETASAVESELRSQKKRNSKQLKQLEVLNKFAWNNLKPIYAFMRIGSDTLTKLYENIRGGEDIWAVDMHEAAQYRKDMDKKFNVKDWDMDKSFTFQSAGGLDFELTVGQMMSVYAYSRREQAKEHLRVGGIVVDPNAVVKEKTKAGITIEYIKDDATAYNITDETLVEIVKILRKENPDILSYVEQMQTYLSEAMGDKGNEVSMKLYGVKQFTEENYFPLRSSHYYMEAVKDQQGAQVKLKNSGFTKATKPNANNPVVLSSFLDLWADHVNEMSMYHAFTLPLEDFYKVYNYKGKNTDDTDLMAIDALIQNVHGSAAGAYIEQMLKDINGDVVSDNRESFGKSMIARFKKAAVFTSMSVVVQQPSAIGRAFALVEPKHFRTTVGVTEHEKLMEEMRKYAPVTIIKEMGYFDTAMGMSARDFLLQKEYDSFEEKVNGVLTDSQYRDEWLGKLPALMDELTWCTIWDAVKRETFAAAGDNVAYGSEEHLKIAGERFTEVITKTQVYDSVLSRSANMRSKSTFMGMITSFMAEPTTSANMVEDAVRKYLAGDKKACGRTMAAVMVSVTLNALLASIVYAARDDDEDETFLEKYASSFATEMVDGLNPMTYIPVLRDVWSYMLGYDIERADMSLITEFIDTLNTITDVFGEDTDGMTDEELEEHYRKVREALLQMSFSVANLMGISWKNIYRDFSAFGNAMKTVAADLTERDTTMQTFTDKLIEGALDSIPEMMRPDSKSKKEDLFLAYYKGNEEMQKRLTASYDSEKDAAAALKSVIRDKYKRDMLNKSTAVQMLKLYVGLNDSEIEKLINEWDCKLETGIDYEDIHEEFVSGEITEEQALEMRMKYGGYSETEAQETIESWKFEKTWGFTYSDRVEMYKEGQLSEADMRKIMREYGGYTEVEINNYMKAYNWMKRNPQYDLTVSEALSYTKAVETLGVSAEDAGIMPNVFVEYKTMASACKGVDSDGDGTADRNSKKNQILAVIDDMPISNFQKDVLYYMNGWARSTLRKAPWH